MTQPRSRRRSLCVAVSPRTRASRASTPVVVAAILTTLTATLASSQDSPLPLGAIPDQPDGHIAVQASNSTVRPEAREFTESTLARIDLPDGFRIDVFADGL